MTTSSLAGDHRRATSIVVHYGTCDQEGINVIVRETVETSRVTPLILAVCTLHQQIVPTLFSHTGMACLEAMLTELANTDDDPDINRAGRLIVAHDADDLGAINNVLREAKDADRITELIIALMASWSALCPQLYSPLGLDTLRHNVAIWALREEAVE